MKSDFVNLLVRPIRTQTGAPHVSIAFQEKDRPVLNVVGGHRRDFSLESVEDFAFGKGAADPGGHLGITPEGLRQGQIGTRPAVESKAGSGQEVSS